MIQIIAVHLDGLEHLQHIAQLRWVQVTQPGAQASTSPQDATRADMVGFVRSNPEQAFALSADGTKYAYLEVVEASLPYVRTSPDKTTTDNLLSLPRF